MNTCNLKLDLDKRTIMDVVRIRQGDENGTTIVAELYDHGTRFTTAGLTSRFCMRLPDGIHYYRKNATYNAGTCTVTIDETEAASVVGRSLDAYFQILSGSTVIASTSSFAVEVLRDALEDATLPESYDNAIQDAIDAIPGQVDTTVIDYLTEQGVGVGYSVTDGDLSIVIT